MKREKIFFLAAVIFLFVSLRAFCEDDINLLPMYGEKEKTEEQIANDKRFIEEVIKAAGSREKALEHALKRAWEYYYKDDLATAMKRFNQAWLLDPNNAECYWGFGIILGRQKKMEGSRKMLEKALELDPQNSKIMVDLAYTLTLYSIYNDLDADEKNKILLKSISLYEQAEKIDDKYFPMYNNWAVALMVQEKFQEALDKLNYAKSLGFKPDPGFIKDLKKMLKEQKIANRKNKSKEK